MSTTPETTLTEYEPTDEDIRRWRDIALSSVREANASCRTNGAFYDRMLDFAAREDMRASRMPCDAPEHRIKAAVYREHASIVPAEPLPETDLSAEAKRTRLIAETAEVMWVQARNHVMSSVSDAGWLPARLRVSLVRRMAVRTFEKLPEQEQARYTHNAATLVELFEERTP